MPTLFGMLYFNTTEVGKINLVLVGSVNIYVVNVESKVITSRKYVNKLFHCN